MTPPVHVDVGTLLTAVFTPAVQIRLGKIIAIGFGLYLFSALWVWGKAAIQDGEFSSAEKPGKIKGYKRRHTNRYEDGEGHWVTESWEEEM